MIGKKWLTACGIVVFWLISMMCQAVSIIYDNTWRDAYGQVLERTVFSLDECTGHDDYIMELFTDTDVTAMEAYDIQATVLQKNTRYSYYWYPHYMATVVLAVSDDCPYDITGWHSLQPLPVTVCTATIFFFCPGYELWIRQRCFRPAGRAGTEKNP